MMFRVHVLFAGGLVALLAGTAVPALAQDAGWPRPYRGLFGNASETTAVHKIDATMSLTEAYDSESFPPELANAGLPQPESIGRSTMLRNSVEYVWAGRPVEVNASASGGLRYYPAVDDIGIVNGSATVAASALLPARSVVAFSQSASYTPSYLYSLFPQSGGATLGEAAPPPSPDYAVNDSASYSYGSALTLAYNPLGVNSVVAAADRQQMMIKDGPVEARQDLTVKSIQAQYGRRLRRNATLTALYRFRSSAIVQRIDIPGFGEYSEQGLEIGVLYRRPLSATRQFTIDGRIGSGALRLPEALKARSVTRRPYRLLGDVTVGYRFQRTWQANASYRGSFNYVPGMVQPVSADGVTTSVDGYLARRINMLVSAAYSNGEATWTPTTVRFTTYTGNVRMRFTLTSMLAAYGEYLYYVYDFRGTTLLVPGIPRQLERSGIRAGFTMLLPVLRSR